MKRTKLTTSEVALVRIRVDQFKSQADQADELAQQIGIDGIGWGYLKRARNHLRIAADSMQAVLDLNTPPQSLAARKS